MTIENEQYMLYANGIYGIKLYVCDVSSASELQVREDNIVFPIYYDYQMNLIFLLPRN